MEKPPAAHNPEVVGSSPAPATTKPSDLVKIRRFFFTFCLKKFSEKLCGFAKFAVDPNRDPYGSKNRPGGGISASDMYPEFWTHKKLN